MWRSDTRNVAARASAVRLGQTEGGNARSRPYLIDDEAGAGQRLELNAQVKRLPQRPRTHAKDLASVRQTRRYASHPTGAPEPLRAGSACTPVPNPRFLPPQIIADAPLV